MRKLLLAFVLCLFSMAGHSQLLDPVKWESEIEKLADGEYQVTLKGNIEKGWHLYSQYTPDGGSLPATLEFKNAQKNYEVIGDKAEESQYVKKYNDIFGVDEYFFEDKVEFKQKIKVTNETLKEVHYQLFYQVCADGQCINFDKFFVFDVKELSSKEVGSFENLSTPDSADEVKNTEEKTVESKKESRSIWGIFIVSFFAGFLALLTPCVFPMIPMTVSFFTKQSKSRAKGIKNAVIYGISIIVIYVLLGYIITKIFGADALNQLSTDPYFNVIFFIILVVFATSFLGAFEIMLPNSWANKVDKQADRGGLIGIFFMALALAIVSFSCTGPIVGSILVEATFNGGIAPLVGMFGFSLALALPFMLFAMFPAWLNSMPSSGGWMNTVKVSLGFLELALAFKFLSNADLVLQLHWIEREVFLVIWIVIFGAWAMYLFGKFALPHDSPVQKLSVGRLFMALIVSAFTLYMVPGLWGAPLKLISAFPPPLKYAESPNGVGGASIVSDDKNKVEGTKEIINGIYSFTDYEKGMAYAKEVGKPVMLDFTGHACVNCRNMEMNVWSNEEVAHQLRDQVVVISLYVDENIDLPESEQYVSETTGKKIKTVGNKWSDFQINKYKANAQPYYVLIDNEGNNLNEPVGYTPNVKEYNHWLKDGIGKYKK